VTLCRLENKLDIPLNENNVELELSVHEDDKEIPGHPWCTIEYCICKLYKFN